MRSRLLVSVLTNSILVEGGGRVVAAGGAAPIAVASQTANNSGATNTTAHTLNLPASLVSGNKLILAAMASNTTRTWTWPAGYTELSDAGALAIAHRTIDGTEGSTITVTCSGNVKGAFCAIQVENWTGTPEVGTTATGTSTTPDPPSISPSWGADDGMVIAIAGVASDGDVTGWPSTYVNTQQSHSSGNAVAIGSATKNITAASEDPGTFTVTSGTWAAQSVAIRQV